MRTSLLTIKEYDHLVWLMTPPLCGKKCIKEKLEADWTDAALDIDEELSRRGLTKDVKCPHRNDGVHPWPSYKGKQAMDRYLKSRGKL